MSGLTDKQFEMVCDLAERAATVEIDGQPATDVRNLPNLLEELLAAARRGLTVDVDAVKFIDLPLSADDEDAPVNELGPENGRAICATADGKLYLPKPNQTMIVDDDNLLNITQVDTNKDDQGNWPADAWPTVTIKGYFYTYPPPNRTVNSNETTGGES